jgi:ATPase subunit of ABC transporter with duplicated ATPase domains
MPYLKLSAACLAYGHVPLLDHADFQLDPGERVALIGRNGTGKSSLLAAMAAGTGRGVWMMAKSGRSRASVSAMCRRSRLSTRR